LQKLKRRKHMIDWIIELHNKFDWKSEKRQNMSGKFVYEMWVKSLKWQNVVDELNMGFERRRQKERINWK